MVIVLASGFARLGTIATVFKHDCLSKTRWHEMIIHFKAAIYQELRKIWVHLMSFATT